MNDREHPWSDHPEFRQWQRILGGEGYQYGDLPGAVALRAVSYHRRFQPEGGEALDLGCGEGQDLVFLAQQGYRATGLDFVPAAVEKSRRLLARAEQQGEALLGDVTRLGAPDGPLAGRQFDLVLCVNVIMFLGAAAAPFWEALRETVRPGGVLGFSAFGLREGDERVAGSRYTIGPEGLLRRLPGWQFCETALVCQWDRDLFLTAIARRPG